MLNKGKKGFTLIELLIVIAIIAVLAAIIFVAVDPARRGAQSRNARRSAEVTSILNAVMTYVVDEEISDVGTLGITTSAQDVKDVEPMNGYLVSEYLAIMPVDPLGGPGKDCFYTIKRSGTELEPGNRLTVAAPCTELTLDPDDPAFDISVSR